MRSNDYARVNTFLVIRCSLAFQQRTFLCRAVRGCCAATIVLKATVSLAETERLSRMPVYVNRLLVGTLPFAHSCRVRRKAESN
jgi:hypothetical protein